MSQSSPVAREGVTRMFCCVKSRHFCAEPVVHTVAGGFNCASLQKSWLFSSSFGRNSLLSLPFSVAIALKMSLCVVVVFVGQLPAMYQRCLVTACIVYFICLLFSSFLIFAQFLC